MKGAGLRSHAGGTPFVRWTFSPRDDRPHSRAYGMRSDNPFYVRLELAARVRPIRTLMLRPPTSGPASRGFLDALLVALCHPSLRP